MEAKLDTQINLEKLYAKNHTMRRIKAEFTNAGAEKFIASIDLPVEFGLDLLAQMQLHKRATVGILVGLLWKHFEQDYPENPFQACANALHYAAQKDVMNWSNLDQRFVIRPDRTISDAVQKEIDQYQFPLPMIVEPREITDNRTTGYYTIPGSVILKHNHHDDDVVLEHLNRMNGIKLSLNMEVVRHVQNQWKNHQTVKEGETFAEFQKRMKAFEKYDETSRDIIEALKVQGNEFFLTHKYDKRGRTYCQGYHVNYQGNDWNKAVVELAEKECINAS